MEEFIEEENALNCELGVQFLLRGRSEALFCVTEVKIHPDWLEDSDMSDLMDLAVEHVLEEIDTVGTHRLVFTDARKNKHIIILKELQAVSILAPDELPGVANGP